MICFISCILSWIIFHIIVIHFPSKMPFLSFHFHFLDSPCGSGNSFTPFLNLEAPTTYFLSSNIKGAILQVEHFEFKLRSPIFICRQSDTACANPNKVGIRYRPTRFHVFNEGVVIGMIQVPAFYQPPHSNNLTLETLAIFYCVNVTQILSTISLKQNSSTKSVALASIMGDVAAQVKLLNVNLPEVKLAVECAINIDQNDVQLSNQMVYSLKAAKYNTISLPMNIRGSFSNKCSASIYI